MILQDLKQKIAENANPQNAQNLSRFFKTGKGQYGEGDIFVGIKVPVLRQLSRQFKDLPIPQTIELLHSPIHEERLLSLFILIQHFNKATESVKEEIFNLYLQNRQFINNWDLVDLSAPSIVGKYLLDKDCSILSELAKSDNLWDKRIAIVSTYTLIRNFQFIETLKLSKILLYDKHDLIHKGVGWMLREMGKRDISVLRNFLNIHYNTMPRTMLRYSIEKFEESERQKYLKGLI